MNIKNRNAYKFINNTGLLFWLFIIIRLIFIFTEGIETGAPEPTISYALLFIVFGSFAIILFIGCYIIIPISYIACLVLFILDICNIYSNKTSRLLTNNSYLAFLGFLGFIIGGIISFLAIKYGF